MPPRIGPSGSTPPSSRPSSPKASAAADPAQPSAASAPAVSSARDVQAQGSSPTMKETHKRMRPNLHAARVLTQNPSGLAEAAAPEPEPHQSIHAQWMNYLPKSQDVELGCKQLSTLEEYRLREVIYALQETINAINADLKNYKQQTKRIPLSDKAPKPDMSDASYLTLSKKVLPQLILQLEQQESRLSSAILTPSEAGPSRLTSATPPRPMAVRKNTGLNVLSVHNNGKSDYEVFNKFLNHFNTIQALEMDLHYAGPGEHAPLYECINRLRAEIAQMEQAQNERNLELALAASCAPDTPSASEHPHEITREG
jgi:hypothetical protein